MLSPFNIMKDKTNSKNEAVSISTSCGNEKQPRLMARAETKIFRFYFLLLNFPLADFLGGLAFSSSIIAFTSSMVNVSGFSACSFGIL